MTFRCQKTKEVKNEQIKNYIRYYYNFISIIYHWLFYIYGKGGRNMKRLKNIDYRHYICGVITIIFLLFAIFYFKYADDRIAESFTDLKNSCLFYINNLFDLNLKGELSVNDFSSCPLALPLNLPNNWEDFKILWGDYWSLWANKENFMNYINSLGSAMYYVSKVLIIVMPVILILIIAKN